MHELESNSQGILSDLYTAGLNSTTCIGIEQGIHAALAKAAHMTVVVPTSDVPEDLQEPLFLDADTTEQIAAMAADIRGAIISARRASMLGWDPNLMQADSSKPEVKKLGPVRPITGAKDVLDLPKFIYVAANELKK